MATHLSQLLARNRLREIWPLCSTWCWIQRCGIARLSTLLSMADYLNGTSKQLTSMTRKSFHALHKSNSPWFLCASLSEQKQEGSQWEELQPLVLPFVLRSQLVLTLSHLHYPIKIPLPLSYQFCSSQQLTWWYDSNFHFRGVLGKHTLFRQDLCPYPSKV